MTPKFKPSKAIAATVTTVAGILTLLGASMGDGLSSAEVVTLIGAIATAAVTVFAVWTTRNNLKPDSGT